MQAVSPNNSLRTTHAVTTRDLLTRTYLIINHKKQRFFRRKVIVAQLVPNISEGHPTSSFYNEGKTSMFLRNDGRPNNTQGFIVLSPEKLQESPIITILLMSYCLYSSWFLNLT